MQADPTDGFDLIYHGSCLDGAFSLLAFHLFSKSVQLYSSHSASALIMKLLQQFKINKQPSLLNTGPTDHTQSWNTNVEIPQNLEQEESHRFYTQTTRNCRYISVSPGELTEGFIQYLAKAGRRLVVLLDNYGESLQRLEKLASSYEYVLVIDHHVSGESILKQINRENVFHYFSPTGKCAFELTLDFLQQHFQLWPRLITQSMYQYLSQISRYVSANDLKTNESLDSKYFSLGFYDFGIELTSTNPLMLKRLANLSMSYLLTKGKNLFALYLNQIRTACFFPLHIQILPLKIQCLGLELGSFEKVSDLGLILSEESSRRGLANLAIFFKFNKSFNEYRVSTRSSKKSQKQPEARNVAEYLGGGGHELAAGCRVKKDRFKSMVKFVKSSTKLVLDENMLIAGLGLN